MQIKYFILGVIATFIIIFVTVGSFYLGKTGKLGNGATPTPSQVLSKNYISTPTPKEQGFRVILENLIKESVLNKDYTRLENFMAENIEVRLEQTECCGVVSAKEAVEKMKYINAAKAPWIFSQKNEDIQNIISTYPENYSNSLIGISTNGYMVAFQFNDKNFISKISMSSNFKSLIQ